MNVLLCSTYELGHQPLALAQPAAHLRAAGFDVACHDLAVERLERQLVGWSDMVAISVPMHTAIRLGARLGREVKAIKPGVHLCYYGLYASLNADYLLQQGADSVIGGEFEAPLTALARRLGRTDVGTSTGTIDGVQLAGGVDVTPFLGRQQFLLPARDLLPPLERYSTLEWGDVSKTAGYVEASRGCAHKCLHCPVPAVYEGRVRIVQEDVVARDIEQLVGLGARHIEFGDPDFLNGIRHSLRVLRRAHEQFPDLTFNFTAKIEHIVEHRGAIAEVARLGCIFITSAVESLSDDILEKLQKGHTEADVRAAKGIADEAGLVIRPTFVSFTPWTRVQDYLHLMEVVEELGWIDNVAPIQYAIRLLVPPGSCLLGRPYLDPHLTGFDEDLFTYRWRHPDPAMDELSAAAQRLVHEAEASDENPRITFFRLKSLALSVATGRHVDLDTVAALPEQQATPRLSEPWFC
jgi:radical SAM superfamily enzyme YgiQ (UPF0313 family)